MPEPGTEKKRYSGAFNLFNRNEVTKVEQVKSWFTLTNLVLVLCVLIVANFLLDYKRSQDIEKRLQNIEGKLQTIEGKLQNIEGKVALVERRLKKLETIMLELLENHRTRRNANMSTLDNPTATDTCPKFGDWLPWTDQCLWFPLANMRKDMAEACHVTYNTTGKGGNTIPTPPGFTIPDRCGHCSFKFRCRKREKTEGCLSIDGDKQTCNEFSDICTIPPAPFVGCKWNVFAAGIKACLNRVDMPDWRRDAYRKFADGLPEGNCIQKGGECKCCCHPYRPSDDGTTCVKETEPTCTAFGKWNDWSQCLWYPFGDMMKQITTHCNWDLKDDTAVLNTVVPTAAGFQIPEKCGFCSFRMRCRNRDKSDGCFHLDADKKACGSDDCPTCGDACTMKKLNGTCNWGAFMASTIHAKLESMTATKEMPYWRNRGMKSLMRHIPYGTCKEVGETCKCCCHPYEPNDDGTACVLTQMCALEPTH